MEYVKLNKDAKIHITVSERKKGKTLAALNYILENNLKDNEVLFITPCTKKIKDYFLNILNFKNIHIETWETFSNNIKDMTFELYLNILRQYKLIMFDDIPKEEALIFAVASYLLLPDVIIIFSSRTIN